jgi:predicted ATPase/class 3 adenylate cyclase
MSEIKALLMTDVVDSTKLSEQIGDSAMAAVWAAHDRAARDLLPAWRGREIDKTDGMLLLFDTAADAAGYALAYHRALGRLPVPLKARAGLHLGPVILRENRADDVARGAKPLEVDGLAKPVAARVMSVARGGQTLLTPEAMAALGAMRLEARSHGHWAMKGAGEPVELFEIGDASSPFVPPADNDKAYRVVAEGERWLPMHAGPNNLPRLATPFVGREREIDDLASRLHATRLITLLGSGGLGKTRLALQVATESQPRFPDGAWFIDLSSIDDPARVVVEAARVLGVSEVPGRPLIEALCAHLNPRRALLIVDRCEHLNEAAGDLIDAVVRAAPGARVLASSRDPLDLPGEQSYPVLPLPLPDGGVDRQALAQSAAVRLFVGRARLHRADFALEDCDGRELAALLRRLEGLPLAIELAAARLRTLELSEVADAIAEQLQAIGEGRDPQSRERTMDAVVQWSARLLAPAERSLLDRLATIGGSFDIAAAMAACDGVAVDAEAVAALVDSLAAKSLVQREQQSGTSRWRIHDSIREAVRERLDEIGQGAPAGALR